MIVDNKREILQRLKTAFKKTKKLFEDNPIPRDLHPGTNIANYWPIITATYSGLEQTLKFLIAIENSQSIQEFLTNDANFTHNLSYLFGQLGNQTKNMLEDDYIQFQSLHCYIPKENIGSFIEHVSGSDGKGYQLWRYSLIQYYNQPPVNSVEAMIAIWGTCIEICEYRIYQNFEPRFPAQKFQFKLKQSFNVAYKSVSISDQNQGKPFPNIVLERNLLYQRFGCPLNLFVKVLWNYDRFETHGLDDVSEKLSEVINEFAKSVLENREKYKDSSFKLFLDRLTGRTIIGESIWWNSQSGKFENVPWSLDYRSVESEPKNAIKVRIYTVNEIKSLRKIFYKNDFIIKENLSFHNEDISEKDHYCCIMEVSEKGSKEPVFSLWQQKIYSDRIFYFVEENAIETLNHGIEKWIRDKKRKQILEKDLGQKP